MPMSMSMSMSMSMLLSKMSSNIRTRSRNRKPKREPDRELELELDGADHDVRPVRDAELEQVAVIVDDRIDGVDHNVDHKFRFIF